ncbi:hypothetical protein CkaCkLH20_03487 [Colletotrichum karsti]|uniref:Uncharacterized protein n=1 Tax=Colletotrichum karsti TaxID=1095194 RepID=A0A9P6LKD0_9PEZI|nr:uncharacterized protein CkaCkLH20_03487 [Colletotrichum karsti]KAF9879254.1 hypothetical protein CkaCkLH20_03487 [Colletotrichum karsti]
MAPASQEPEPASPTTNRPDGESVDNIAQAASALEANLTNLENRLDALLAAFEATEEPQKEGDSSATAKDDKPNKGDAHNGDSSNGQKEQNGSGHGAASGPSKDR